MCNLMSLLKVMASVKIKDDMMQLMMMTTDLHIYIF